MDPVLRDPVPLECWAPEAGVDYGTSLKPPALLQPPAPAQAQEEPAAADILDKRRRHLGPNLALFFPEDPLHIVRGQGCELFDPEGRSYLDCINNVSHVGHGHPRVAAAVAQQLSLLNTNSRYLSGSLADYCEALAHRSPDPLEVVYMLTSGSEANDLAWRMARAAARASVPDDARPLHVAVMDHAYHGHTSTCIDLSPYKFKGPGGAGRPAHVHVLPCPDPYRGTHLDGAAAARRAIAAAEAAGGRLAAFYCESVISCGGQIFLPEGYLADVHREMRAAGTLCVADEVQCGFGRLGPAAFWAFQPQGVVPDIVTFGKPCGNGFPMAGLITTPAVAQTFSNGMEFFATTGGCTAAGVCGLAVLEVLQEEGLQDNAAAVGAHCLARLHELQAAHPDVVGEVRGEGLMLGVELVVDPATKAHHPALARHLRARCKGDHHVLLSSEGPFCNVIKVKPPICFTAAQADRMVDAIAAVLANLTPEDKAALAEASAAEVDQIADRLRRLS